MTAAGFSDVTVEGLDGIVDIGPDSGRADDLAPGLLGWTGSTTTPRKRLQDALRRTTHAHTAPDGVRFGAIV